MKQIIEALIAFQKECPTVRPDSENKHLKQKYATRGAILKTVLPILNKHGLTLLQIPTKDGEDLVVETHILHSSGERIELGFVPYKDGTGAKNENFEKGISLQYALRYGLNALGIVTDEDKGHDKSKVSVAPPKPQRTIEEAREGCLKALEASGIDITDDIRKFAGTIDTEEKLKEFYTSTVKKEQKDETPAK